MQTTFRVMSRLASCAKRPFLPSNTFRVKTGLCHRKNQVLSQWIAMT